MAIFFLMFVLFSTFLKETSQHSETNSLAHTEQDCIRMIQQKQSSEEYQAIQKQLDSSNCHYVCSSQCKPTLLKMEEMMGCCINYFDSLHEVFHKCHITPTCKNLKKISGSLSTESLITNMLFVVVMFTFM